MIRAVLAVFAVATLVAVYGIGQDHGIRVGVEETTRFYQQMAPPCVPAAPLTDTVPVS